MTYVTARSILLHIVISSIHSIVVNGRITIAPKDTEVLDGHSTYLNCSSSIYDKYVTWYFYPVGGTGIDRKYVYFSGRMYNPYIGRVGIDISVSGVCNLIIYAAMQQDAGRYDCQDDGGIGETKSAQLIVLAANPRCKSASNTTDLVGRNTCGINPDELQLSCSVEYNGNIPPVMEWKSVGEDESLFHYTSHVKEGNMITYNLTLNAKSQRNGSSYSCHTTRSRTPAQYNCTSDIFSIAYAFSDNITVNASVGDRLICTANTSVACDYKWKRYVEDCSVIESDGSALVPKIRGWYRCEAECKIKKSLCSFFPMAANVFEKEREQISAAHVDLKTILVPVAAVLLLLLVATVIFTFCFRRVKKERETFWKQLKEIGIVVEILYPTMYIYRQGSSLITVYDLYTKPFGYTTEWRIQKYFDIVNVADLAASKDDSYLFILDNKCELSNCEIKKITIKGEFLGTFKTDFTDTGTLSTTWDNNVILCRWKINKIIEYSILELPCEGVLYGEIKREITYTGEGVLHPWFCIKTFGEDITCTGEGLDQRFCVKTYTVYLASYKYEGEQSNIIRIKITEQDIEEKHLTLRKENLVGNSQMWKREKDCKLFFGSDGSRIYMPDVMPDRIVILDLEFKILRHVKGYSNPVDFWIDNISFLYIVRGEKGITIREQDSDSLCGKCVLPAARPEPEH